MTVIYPFQTREVRDLAWACFSDPLMHVEALCPDTQAVGACALNLTPGRVAWLEQLDRDAAPLLAHLEETATTRLGLYFESLWHFFLRSDPQTDLVAHNLPVRDGGQTVGEFDCIYFCHRRQCHVHLELAVKLYLGLRSLTTDPDYSQWQEWWGPNTADRLDIKLTRMMQRQIRLGEHPAARRQLQALGIMELAHEVEIKGYLFRNARDSLPPPQGFNPANRLQGWTRLGQLASHLEARLARNFIPLPRLRWLAPAQNEQLQQTLDMAGLASLLDKHFAASNRPMLIASLDDRGLETDRFFVTPDDWLASPDQLPVATGQER